MASKLLDADVSSGRIAATLRQLRDQLPSRPLSSVRLVVVGNRVIVQDRLASWVLESGQGVLGLGNQATIDTVDSVAALPVPPDPDAVDSAGDLYQVALDLELAGRDEDAEAAYMKVLELDPDMADARINLGRLLHGAGQLPQAEALYRHALEQEPGNALAAFNLGVVLEDQERVDAAIEAYRRAIASDDEHADAHFNLSRLLEARGDRQAALRHLVRFRRLTR